jgi:CRP/FNR family cyclic AMP-dependent transcriptional regulator
MKPDFLGQHPLFSDMTPDERTLLMQKVRTKRFSDGEAVFQRGDQGTFMVSPQTGRVRIVLYSDEGKEVLLNLIEPGQVFGEFSFLDGGLRSASAIADGDCTLMLFDRADLLPVMKQNPNIALKLLGQMSALLRQNTDLIETIALLPLPARLARVLLRLAKRYGKTDKNGILVDSNLNQNEYGQLIATSRESVNKQLRLWQQDGLIEFSNDRVLIRDMQALTALAHLAE